MQRLQESREAAPGAPSAAEATGAAEASGAMSAAEIPDATEAPGAATAPAARRARRAMVGLACVRIGLGAAAWIAPRAVNRAFGLPRSEGSAALVYMNRIFGVRAIALGLGYLASEGEARRLWHRLWLLCDAADTAMGVAMVARGQLGGATAAEALALTGGSAAVDLAALLTREPGGAP